MPIDPQLRAALDRIMAQEIPGAKVEFFLPGGFILNGNAGLYPAISLTGGRCDLGCAHCRGRLLAKMIPAPTPERLLSLAFELQRGGRVGLLVSGGSDPEGHLPWRAFLPAIAEVIRRTNLAVTVHAGYLDRTTARALKTAGVRQALVDVIGDDETARQVYRLKRGAAPVWETLEALTVAGVEIVPHIVVGLNFGRLRGEEQALEGLRAYRPSRLVTVVIRPLAGTPMKAVQPPPVAEVVRFLLAAREVLPDTRHQLGCARPGGRYRKRLDRLALQAGIRALAVPSDEAWEEAERLELSVQYRPTCCSWSGRVLPGESDRFMVF